MRLHFIIAIAPMVLLWYIYVTVYWWGPLAANISKFQLVIKPTETNGQTVHWFLKPSYTIQH